MKPIIIIESPNKIEKIKQITGYEVESTTGHFMNLDNIDVNNDYKTKFSYDPKKKSKIFNIIEKCKNNEVYIATDPDREGYAIGYLLYEKIKNVSNKVYRAEFHEITENGIKKGLKEAILFANTNFNYYYSFLGRRVADRIIGFTLSPILIKEIKAKSAGRVQTPALKLIVDRDNEIKEFEKLPLESKLSYQIQTQVNIDRKKLILKHSLNNEEIKSNKKEELEKTLNNIVNTKEAYIENIEIKEEIKSPPKPLTTSKLLKIASKKLNISIEEITTLAQNLFEKGLITYIRTDSEFISLDFLKEMKEFYEPIYKDNYEYKEYKAGKKSQAEAHEAIRITHFHRLEELKDILNKEDITNENAIKLYELIFLNTLASQLKAAKIKKTNIKANIRLEEFNTSIKSITYKGYLELYSEETKEDLLEELNINKNNPLKIEEISIKEIKQNGPKQYLESDFIEILEKKGIGRPSTYSSYIPKLLKREYITIKNKYLEPTNLGIGVIEFLNEHNKYNFILDLEFTKNMESKLDLIKSSEYTYIDFIKEIHEKLDFLPLNKETKTTDIKPPTQAQLDYCKLIAEKLNIELPNNLENNWKIASDFINKNKPKLSKIKIINEDKK